ncbi:MAG: asparagine synthase (glutamine-hydrolyzing) [Chitinophagaceae bacterium]
MCGIAGSINHSLNIPLLTKDLFHRGPDEQTTFEDRNLQLHHHRLSILDIAGGKQPMHYEHLTIIFNGQVYNHLDVRAKYNLVCKTNSDTETILQSYARVGPACLNDFDGMFAFAIYDRNKGELFLARDRAGKKPLYYFSNAGKLIFASELNAIKGQVELRINEQNLHQYVRMGYFYKSETPYQNVWELPAGSYTTISLSNPIVQVQRWWNIFPFYENRIDDDLGTASEKVDSMLHKAVKDRVESSDLEVGSFLSGGIDSGLVTAIATKYNPSLKTFTVSFPGEYDEAPLAKMVAEQYHTRHHEIRISFDHLMDDTETILANYGEPHYDESAIPSYYVSREAKKHLTVILNGDGGDELFGGYRRYVPFAKMDFFKNSPLRENLFRMLYHLTPSTAGKMNKINYLRRMFFLGSRSGFDTYLSATTDIFEGFEKKVFQPEFISPGKEIEADFSKVLNADLTGLQKAMLLDFDNILPSLLLVKMDIATMAHSLEGRSPLLSKALLEYVPSLSDNNKIRGTTTKYLLRDLAKKYLPHELINQPKRGFEPPLRHWVDHELRSLIGDYINAAGSLYPSLVNKKFVQDLFDNRVSVQPEKRAKMLWLIFTMEVWYKKVFKTVSS